MKLSIPYGAQEYVLVPLCESLPPSALPIGDSPEAISTYLRKHIALGETETAYVVFLSVRRKITGHIQISNGTLDTLLIHPRDVFRAAIIRNAAVIVVVHTHPSGDPSPSEADIKVTRDLRRAGETLKIELMDHIILGHPANVPPYVSLRSQGYFA